MDDRPADSYIQLRCYTEHRKLQTFIGKVHGTALPFVLTLLQAGVLAGGIFAMYRTLSWWGPILGRYGALGYLFGMIGVPAIAAFLLRKPKVGGRWIWQAALGGLSFLSHQIRDAAEERREVRAVAVGRKVWVTN
jgi:xanthosine utilization system XapX-like protein